ncbi:30S ribosomal protein S15 [Buchnera aphidicola (Mollitrichosiphum nigrofasciatum)]|uniref:30S ribosomal protein S15 n=1 Tax=Buchnera aphidicola TaxID=9 RepID=UPI0031B801F2
MSIALLNKKVLIIKYGQNILNTGNISVQIISLTLKINNLQKHFLLHKKDHSGKRGLLNMVSRRRKLLTYLKRKFLNIYINLIRELNLRR